MRVTKSSNLGEIYPEVLNEAREQITDAMAIVCSSPLALRVVPKYLGLLALYH